MKADIEDLYDDFGYKKKFLNGDLTDRRKEIKEREKRTEKIIKAKLKIWAHEGVIHEANTLIKRNLNQEEVLRNHLLAF
jgi:hypothetical protein